MQSGWWFLFIIHHIYTNHSNTMLTLCDASILGLLFTFSLLACRFIPGSGFLNFAFIASTSTESAIFDVQATISIRSDATVTTGTMSRNSVSCHSPVFSRALRVLPAAFASAMCFSLATGQVIVRRPIATSVRAKAHSELILVQKSWIFVRSSNGVCTSETR